MGCRVLHPASQLAVSALAALRIGSVRRLFSLLALEIIIDLLGDRIQRDPLPGLIYDFSLQLLLRSVMFPKCSLDVHRMFAGHSAPAMLSARQPLFERHPKHLAKSSKAAK